LKKAAREFKTPLKPTQKSTEEEIGEMLDLVAMEDVYKRKISDVTDFVRTVDETLLAGVIQGIEEKLEEVSLKTIILDKTKQVSKN
jgi:hypothetical protein